MSFKDIQEVYTSPVTGVVSIEYTDGSLRDFNVADTAVYSYDANGNIIGLETPTGTLYAGGGGGGGGVSNHSALTGLSNDDHHQYFNATRGDARYSQTTHTHTGVYQPASSILTGTTASFTTTQESTIATLPTTYQPLNAVLTGTTASYTTAKDAKLNALDTNVQLRDRSTHTGTQANTTITTTGKGVVGKSTTGSGVSELLTLGNSLVLTGTTIDVPVVTGSSVSTAGVAGLVPAPIAGEHEKYLKGDGTWSTIPGVTPTALAYGRVKANTTLPLTSFSITAPGTKIPFNSTVYSSGVTVSGTDSFIPTTTGRYRATWFMLAGSGDFNDDGTFHVVQGGVSKGSVFVDMMQAAGVNQVSSSIDVDVVAGTAVELRYQPVSADSVPWGAGSYYQLEQISGQVPSQVFAGATAGSAGSIGLVPVPSAGDQSKVLTGAGTWVSMGAWNTYVPTITATVTNPSLATTNTLTASYVVIGKMMQINVLYYAATAAGATAGSGSYMFSMPNGYTIDLTKATVPSDISQTSLSGIDGTPIGMGFGHQSGNNNFVQKVVAINSNSFGSYSDSANRLIGSACLPLNNAQTMYSFTLQVPIV